MLDVTAKLTSFGSLEVKLDGQELTKPPPAMPQSASKKDIDKAVSLHTSIRRVVQLAASNLPERLDIGNKHAQKLAIEAGDLKLDIYSAKAGKYGQKDDSTYMHLNVGFTKGLPKGSKGIFAELAGVAPVTQRTKAMLKKPAGHEWQIVPPVH